MDTVLGIVGIALLLGIGSRRWRYAVKEKLAERRYTREWRRRNGLS